MSCPRLFLSEDLSLDTFSEVARNNRYFGTLKTGKRTNRLGHSHHLLEFDELWFKPNDVVKEKNAHLQLSSPTPTTLAVVVQTEVALAPASSRYLRYPLPRMQHP